MISCAQMCLVFVKGYSFYNFFFNSWGASPPDPPLPLFKSLQKSLCLLNIKKLGRKGNIERDTEREKGF